MKIKITILLIFLLSVGLLPTGIFLYAQNIPDKINKAKILFENKNIDDSFVILSELLKDTINLKNNEKADLFYLLSNYYSFKNKHQTEFIFNKNAEKLFRELNNEIKLCDILYAKFDLLDTQKNLDSLENPKKYLDEFFKLSNKNNLERNIIIAYKAYGRLEHKKNNLDMALKFYERALKSFNIVNDSILYADIINNKGAIFYSKRNDSAIFYYSKALKIYKKLNLNDDVFSTSFNIGLYNLRIKNINTALKWFKKADSIHVKKFVFNKKVLLYGYMSDTYEKQKDYKNAYNYAWLYFDYKDSVDLKAQNIAITDQQIKYKSLEKEKKNIELTNANKRKQLYLLGVVGASLGLFSFGFLSYRNVKKKKEIAEKNIAIEHQKFVALVKDQELISMDSMIEGQEKERKRIAEDLHDNLGSTLATLKLHFDNYRAHLSVDNVKQIKMLNSTENILDEAYNKVRTMAHANQASILAEHSLVEAVKSLAYKISSANKTEIEVIDFGFDKSLNHSLEIAVFRIIQELITNIVKHANAKKATIDLTLFEDSLGLIVEDDGQGFNIKKLENKIDGMGLNSIKNRIEHVNGSFVIDTSIGKGTSILIDIPVNKNEI